MLSTRYMFSPWFYYEWNNEAWISVQKELANQRFRGTYYAYWSNKHWQYSHYACGEAWELAKSTAIDVAIDYGVEQQALRMQAQHHGYSGPVMVLRDG